jgi:hypothetical protein
MERPNVRKGGSTGTVQFYNPAVFDPGGPVVEQAITWNAFPKELSRKYGRDRALIEADRLLPLSKYKSTLNSEVHHRTPYRPLNEYCEWHVVRDPDTQAIHKVTFSSEPPEFWQALFGDTIPITDTLSTSFPGDRDRVLRLYQEMVSPEVKMDDLICHETIPGAPGELPLVLKGQYNTYNKWNTTHGIMHLCSPPNSLQAEIQLGADATVLRHDSRGEVVVDPEALICCARYGGPDRNSDPTIGSSVNALARLRAWVTLPNPVGLYMDHIDLSGWAAPDGQDVSDCMRILRGRSGMIERVVVEVPAKRGFTVSDITIAGEPIRYGGQIAECITVKLVGSATGFGTVQNDPIPCAGRCCVDPANFTSLGRAIDISAPTPPGEVDAYMSAPRPSGHSKFAMDIAKHHREIPRHRRVRWI